MPTCHCETYGRLAVLESGLGLESGLKSFFAGLGLGLGTLALKDSDLKAMDLDLDSDVLPASHFLKSLFVPTKPIAL